MTNSLTVSFTFAVATLLGQEPSSAPQGECRRGPEPVVPAVATELEPLVQQHIPDQSAIVLGKLAAGEAWPAHHKLPVRVKGIKDPWGAMAELERSGLETVAAAARDPVEIGGILDCLSEAIGKPAVGGPVKVGGILDSLSGAMGRPLGHVIVAKDLTNLDDHVEHLIRHLDRAKKLRDAALHNVPEKDHKTLFSWTAETMGNMGPQLPMQERTRSLLHSDRASCRIVWQLCEWEQLLGAAHCLAGLTAPGYLEQLENALQEAPVIEEPLDGVTGPVLLAKETAHGWVILGGNEANVYELEVPVALVVDLGGDDVYRGTVAASCDADRANQVVIDLAGNDRYEGDQYGLACGRLGVGILYDLTGDDHYELAPGSGGTGLGGIGVLCDGAGDDTYVGSKYTQGSAIAGIGLLIDCRGDDRYTSFGYSIGFGGPAGVGAVIDRAGNDYYQCGRKYRSAYNKGDVTPDDPTYQYTALGMGTGLGRRILSGKGEDHQFALAGGLGMLVDMAGDDEYDSSNFSQACGYYFGVGLKMDLAGDDLHKAARYGCASGAHFGMGLFVDYCGKDAYLSTGPTYNGGCSWDHSAFLFVEAGTAGDVYQWENSQGPARADIGSWGAFAELGGDDCYRARIGLGKTERTAMAVFFDRCGEDDYQLSEKPDDFTPGDGMVHSQDPGGLFVDK